MNKQTSAEKPPITAIVPYFGAKRNLAADIAAEFGAHSAFWLPFCGSLAPLLAKPPCPMETAVDLHGDLINLARVIRDPRYGAILYRRLRRTLMHEAFFDECDAPFRAGEKSGAADALADGEPLGEANVDRAYLYFLVSWMGRNGTAGMPANHKGSYCVRYTKRGGHTCKRWVGAVASIPAWRRRMANVMILRRDAFEVIGRIADDPGTVIYCDPPYLVKGARYLYDDDAGKSDSTAEAQWREAVGWAEGHAASDITTQRLAWHKVLADLLSRFQTARVLVSYYAHPLLASLYPDWTVRRLVAARAMAHAGYRGNVGRIDAPECLFINGPSLLPSLLED